MLAPMSRMRTRPDESRKPGLITAAGYRALQQEAEQLWTVERPKVVKEVAIAAAEGARSENAEYIYGKRKLAEIDHRLAFLGKRLDVLKVAAERPVDDGRVQFGAYVTLEDEDGTEHCYQIVGSDETDAAQRRISMDAPLALALIGKRIGDEVTVVRPKGEIGYTITHVQYTPR